MRPLRTRTEKDALSLRLEDATGRTKRLPDYACFFVVVLVLGFLLVVLLFSSVQTDLVKMGSCELALPNLLSQN